MQWALDDLAELSTLCINQQVLEELEVRSGAARYAQSIWPKDYQSQQEAIKRWAVESVAAYDLRDKLA